MNRTLSESHSHPWSCAFRCLRWGLLGFVGAVNRILPNYIRHMWTATPDNGLAATLYGPCTVSALSLSPVEEKHFPISHRV